MLIHYVVDAVKGGRKEAAIRYSYIPKKNASW
jgi:hypothetical protein